MQQGIQCNKCGQINYFGSKFCAYCGVKMQYQCPQCNGFLEHGLKFCPSCGMPLTWGEVVQPSQLPQPQQQMSQYPQNIQPPQVFQTTQYTQSTAAIQPSQPARMPEAENISGQQSLPDVERDTAASTIESASSSGKSKLAKEEFRSGKRPNILLIVLIVIILLIAALFVVDMVTKGSLTSGLFRSSPAVPVRATGTVNVTAQSLYLAYAVDRMSAQMLYDDQSLRVNGTVRSTGVAADEMPFITLAGGIDNIGIHCAFDGQNLSQVSQLKPGSSVTVQGICDGYYGTDVRLVRCVLAN